MKNQLLNFLIAVILGLIITIIQALVIHGLPADPGTRFLTEVLFATLYIFGYRIILSRVVEKHLMFENLENLSKYKILNAYLLTQGLAFGWFFIITFLPVIIIIGPGNIQFKDIAQLRFIFVYYFFINTIGFTIGAGIKVYKLYSREKDAKYNAEKAFMNSQLQMLRQQLNSHFLFNNLNIIASTIHSNPQLAFDFTKSMASFYRKILETESAGWIKLKEELKTIRNYLYMLSVRFEDKLKVEIDVDEESSEKYLVPDFILQPVVENIIKHNECRRKNPLTIIIRIEDGGYLTVKNNIQPLKNNPDSMGIGWFNIEKRYEYLEHDAPEKFIEDNWFIVKIKLHNV